MEKNINQIWGIGEIIVCILIFIFILLTVISDITKAKRIQVLEETIEAQKDMIENRNNTINFRDTLINRYETLIIKSLKYE